MSNYLSREAAINSLDNFFKDEPSDIINVDDLFIKMGRDLVNDKTNRSWLSNKLTAMKAYNLLERHYSSRTGKRKLIRLSLTSEGKRALGRAEGQQVIGTETQPSPSLPNRQADSVDVESLLEAVNRNVEILQAKLPSFVVTFSIRPRRELGVSEQIRMGLRKL